MQKSVKWGITIRILLFLTVFSGLDASAKGEKSSKVGSDARTFEKLNFNNIKTEWNSLYLFNRKEDASNELEALNKKSEEINETFSPIFENLSGPILLDYLEAEKEFLRSSEILYIYSYTQLSKNVNDNSFASFLADSLDLLTEHRKANAFATVKLTSLNKEEWDRLFSEEPKLEMYRPYLKATYMRFATHRPMNESQAIYLADIENQRMKLETEAILEITNDVTKAGNITLENGKKLQVNSQSYKTLLSTDKNRENRKKCYDQRFYHLIEVSDSMASLYSEKARLDDLVARQLNYTDYYESQPIWPLSHSSSR